MNAFTLILFSELDIRCTVLLAIPPFSFLSFFILIQNKMRYMHKARKQNRK